MRLNRFFVVAAFVSTAGSLSCHRESLMDPSVAQLEPLRAGVTLTHGRAEVTRGVRRLTVGDAVHTDATGRASISLDAGGRYDLDHGTTLHVNSARSATLDDGRLWSAAPANAARADETLLTAGRLVLHLRGSRASIERHGETARVSVLGGEVAYEAGSERGALRAGETAQWAGTTVTVSHDQVFDDWTGGLADEGDAGAGEAAGLGAVAARRPDEQGSPRWSMVMQRLDAHVVMHGDLAVTTIDQTFFNPSAFTVEGLYTFTAPQGAVLQMFGVDRRGRTVEGIVRERQQAAAQYQAQVYEGSTHDPALLEWDAPGRYHARLYPIPPGASRRVRVRYTQWLAPDAQGRRAYRLPLASLDSRIGELRADVDLDDAHFTSVRTVAGARIESHHVLVAQSDVMPRADLVVELQGPPPAAVSAITASGRNEERGGYLRVAIPVPAESARNASDDGVDLVVLVDHSAATDPVARRLEQAFVEAVVRQLDPRDHVLVLAGDVSTRPLGSVNAELQSATPEQRRALIDAVSHDTFGGATDLSAMIAAAHRALRPDRNGAIVYVGDGAATVGGRDLPALRQMITRLSPRPRFYAVAVGEDPRLDLLTGLAEPAGFAARVARRSDVARTALDLLAHVARPLVRNVRVDLGPDVQSVYPAEPVDLPSGEPMVVVGRFTGNLPRTATVRAEWNGREVTRTVALDPTSVDDLEDLRSRWATMRLDHLLARGESRAVIVELGTRYHLITPFTSYYVASEDEVVSMELRDVRSHGPMIASFSDLTPFDLLPLVGCARSESAPPASVVAPSPSATASAPAAQAPQPAQQQQNEGGSGSRHAGSEGRMGRADSPSRSAHYAAPGAGLGPTGTGSGGGGAGEGTIGLGAAQPGMPAGTFAAPPAPPPEAAEAPAAAVLAPSSGVSVATPPATTAPSARPSGNRRAIHAEIDDERTADSDGSDQAGANLRAREQTGAATDRLTEAMINGLPRQPDDHARAPGAAPLEASRCSDAATASLTERIALWRERLAGHGSPGEMAATYRTARQACELPGQADRAALLRLMLAAAGGVDGQIALYRAMSGVAGARAWLRASILRVLARTGELMRAEALGLGRLNPAEMTTALANAATAQARLSLLRELSRRYPDDVDLGLRLLDAAVETRSIPDVRVTAQRLRDDPQADARVRTAVGEALFTIGDESEARRAFSEIVEFAPDDPLARRRLGDIALSHGWADEAYRQFQVLAEVEHDAPDVLLREAMAARLAGRLDEALRLAERVAQMSSGDAAASVPDAAAAWIGLELALAAATPGVAQDQIQALRARWRRSSAARAAGAVRVVARWMHPDDGAELWVTLPGEGTRRSDMLAGAVFFESTVFADAPTGLQVELRRADGTRARGEAELLVLWNEGTDRERVDRVRVSLDETHAMHRFDVTPTALTEVPIPPAPVAAPITQAERTLGGVR